MERKISSLFRYGVAIASALLPAYEHSFPRRDTEGIESKVTEVSKSEIGDGIAGDFSTVSGRIRVREDLPAPEKNFTYHHEVAHSLGYDGSPEGEYKADVYAASRTGSIHDVRGPFHRPHILYDQSARKQELS